MWKAFSTALTFLTLIPVPFSSPEPLPEPVLARSFSFFPLVGFVLGLCCYSLARVCFSWLPAGVLAVLITGAMALLTRALHLDGVADLADGLGGGYTPQRRLEIMKDSRTGAFGALALVLIVLLKYAALETLVQQQRWTPLILAPVFSRLAIVLAAYKSPYARASGGLGRPFLAHMTAREVLTALLLAMACSLPLHPTLALLSTVSALAAVLLLRALARRTLGGITGDVLGAVNEIVEALILVVGASSLAS